MWRRQHTCTVFRCIVLQNYRHALLFQGCISVVGIYNNFSETAWNRQYRHAPRNANSTKQSLRAISITNQQNLRGSTASIKAGRRQESWLRTKWCDRKIHARRYDDPDIFYCQMFGLWRLPEANAEENSLVNMLSIRPKNLKISEEDAGNFVSIKIVTQRTGKASHWTCSCPGLSNPIHNVSNPQTDQEILREYSNML